VGSGSIKGETHLDQLGYHLFLQMNSTPWSYILCGNATSQAYRLSSLTRCWDAKT